MNALDDRGRRRVLAIAGATLFIAGVATLGGTGAGTPVVRPTIGSPARQLVVGGARTPQPQRRPDAPQPERPSASRLPQPGRLDARRFLAAFLKYETGRLGPATRRTLRATATSALARALGNPPRTSEAHPRARVVSLELAQEPSAASVVYLAVLDRAGQRTPLTLTVIRTGRRWVVADLE